MQLRRSAADLTRRLIHGDGHFLGANQTLDLIQKAYISPVNGAWRVTEAGLDEGLRVNGVS